MVKIARRLHSRAFVSTLSVAAFLVLWEIAPRLGLMNAGFTSQPSRVLAASVQIVGSGGFFRDIGVSLMEFCCGVTLAVFAGVPAGLLLGSFRIFRYLFDPPIMAIYATPQLALLPIFVLWLGIGMESKVAVVFIGAVIPIIVNCMAGVRQVDRSLVLVARSLCARKRDIFLKVVLPASLPAAMIGVRLGMSRGILGVVVAEMYVSQEGIGNQIMKLGSAFRIDYLLVYVLLVSAFGFIATTAVRAIEERLRR